MLLLLAYSPTHADELPELYKRLAPSVVTVLALDAQSDVTSFGSGLIVASDGFIATNHHVIEDAVRIAVKLHSGQVKQAVLLYTDQPRDLAILYTPEKLLAVARLGDSDRVQVGQAVAAIGHPEGLENTISPGIISGIRRAEGLKYLQTTAPMSSGSSGGPVIDMRGEVIGITVFTIQGGQNLNFALPINDVRNGLAKARAELKIITAELAKKRAEEDAERRRAEDEERKRKALALEAAMHAAEQERRKATEPSQGFGAISPATRTPPPRQELPPPQKPTQAPPSLAAHPAPEPARPDTAAPSTRNTFEATADFPFTYYLRQIEAKISEQWAPPKGTLAGGERVVILFEIGRDGQIKEPVVEKSSGHAMYDQSALRAIVDASPFPPLPPEYKAPSLRVHIPFQLGGTVDAALSPARPTTDLYQTAYLDYTRGNYDLAIAAFREFIRLYPTTDLAGKAQYWIAESHLSLARDLQAKGDRTRATQEFERAVQEFRRVLINYPRSDRVPTAVYKEALALIELGQPSLAEARLQFLVDEFPSTLEAQLSRDELPKLRRR